jgi:uncharacterized protein
MTRLALLAAALLTACSTAVPSTTTATTEPPVTTTVALSLPPQLSGWDITRLVLTGASSRELLVAVADDEQERQEGLMGVEDLADLDGMLFVFDGDVATGFWMKDTVLPLDIGFFAADGSFVDTLSMEPCTANPCPVYRPSGTYRYAVEVAMGGFTALTGDEVLTFTE